MQSGHASRFHRRHKIRHRRQNRADHIAARGGARHAAKLRLFQSLKAGHAEARLPATAGQFDRESEMNTRLSSSSATVGSPFSPFRHPAFAVIWTATGIANIGGWMFSAASGWLMTSLNPDPFIVSLVQVATTLPRFLVS